MAPPLFSSRRVSNVGPAAYLTVVSVLVVTACDGRKVETGAARWVTPSTGAPSDADAADPAGPLTVEWGGCAGVRTGPVCELGAERSLTLWIRGAGAKGQTSSVPPAPPAPTDWTVVAHPGGVLYPRGPAGVESDGGIGLTLKIPDGTRAIDLRDANDRRRWFLSVADPRPHDRIDALVTFGRTGQYESALKQLEDLRASLPPSQHGPADAAIGRMALALGKVERAEPAFRSAIVAAQNEGRLSDVVKDAAGLVWALIHIQQRYVDARALLVQMAAAGQQYPEGQVWLDFHAGLLAADTADIRTALDKYRLAERAARRMGLARLQGDATAEVARLLTRLGRTEEALALLRGLPTPSDSCALAAWTLNVVWALMERQALRGTPEAEQEKTVAIASAEQATRQCPAPHWRLLAIAYATEQALQTGDAAGARRLVHELQSAPTERDVLRASLRAEVLGRWFLRRKKPASALAAFDSQLPAARARGLLEEAFRSEVGAGRALLALGRRAAAVSRLEAAQALLETMLRGVPLAEGRGSFLSGRDEGVRTLVAALVDGGAVRQAFRIGRLARAAEVARTARLDRLATLSVDSRRQWEDAVGRYQGLRADIERAAEDDWAVPRSDVARRRAIRQAQSEQARAALDAAYSLLTDDQHGTSLALAEPGPGMLFLLCFPAPEGWFVFAATSADVWVRHIEGADWSSAVAAANTARGVLDLFATKLASARRVRLLLYGVSEGADWHAAVWRGRPLLSSMEVEYGLDIGTPAERHGPRQTATRLAETHGSAGPGAALVVSNPTGDLPSATPESEAVTRVLKGWQVKRLDGAGATRGALLAALPNARLFHYAGHAEIAATSRLSSALLLKGNARVELGDLLALPSVPSVVVLPACEAAGTIEDGRSRMGLAQAFLAAGSEMAVAPVRAVHDRAAAVFSKAFYAVFAGAVDERRASLVDNGHAAFRAAALAVLAQERDGAPAVHPHGGTGWESFRLLVP